MNTISGLSVDEIIKLKPVNLSTDDILTLIPAQLEFMDDVETIYMFGSCSNSLGSSLYILTDNRKFICRNSKLFSFSEVMFEAHISDVNDYVSTLQKFEDGK